MLLHLFRQITYSEKEESNHCSYQYRQINNLLYESKDITTDISILIKEVYETEIQTFLSILEYIDYALEENQTPILYDQNNFADDIYSTNKFIPYKETATHLNQQSDRLKKALKQFTQQIGQFLLQQLQIEPKYIPYAGKFITQDNLIYLVQKCQEQLHNESTVWLTVGTEFLKNTCKKHFKLLQKYISKDQQIYQHYTIQQIKPQSHSNTYKCYNKHTALNPKKLLNFPYNSHNQLSKQSILMHFKSLLTPSYTTKPQWLSLLTYYLCLFSLTKSHLTYQKQIFTTLQRTLIHNIFTPPIDRPFLFPSLLPLLHNIIILFPLNQSILSFLVPNHSTITQLFTLLLQTLLKMRNSATTNFTPQNVQNFINKLVPSLISFMGTHPDHHQKCIQLIILSHSIHPKQYLKELDNAVTNSFAVQSLICLYLEHQIAGQRQGTNTLLLELERELDYFVQFIRERNNGVLTIAQTHSLQDFLIGLTIIIRHGINIILAGKRISSLVGNLFRITLWGVLPQRIHFVMKVIMENKSKESRFYSEMDKKVVLLFQEAAKEQYHLCEDNVHYIFGMLKLFVESCTGKIDASYVSCINALCRIFDRMSLISIKQGCEVIQILMDRQLVNQHFSALLQGLIICRQPLLFIRKLLLRYPCIEILNVYLLFTPLGNQFMLGDQLVSSVLQRQNQLYLVYKTTVYLLKESSFDAQLLQDAYSSYYSAVKLKQYRKIKSIIQLIRALMNQYFYECASASSYSRFIVAQMKINQHMLGKLAYLKNQVYYYGLRSLLIAYMCELAYYYKAPLNEQCSETVHSNTVEDRIRLFELSYERFKKSEPCAATQQTIVKYALMVECKVMQEEQVANILTMGAMVGKGFIEMEPGVKGKLHVEIILKLQELKDQEKKEIVRGEIRENRGRESFYSVEKAAGKIHFEFMKE